MVRRRLGMSADLLPLSQSMDSLHTLSPEKREAYMVCYNDGDVYVHISLELSSQSLVVRSAISSEKMIPKS